MPCDGAELLISCMNCDHVPMIFRETGYHTTEDGEEFFVVIEIWQECPKCGFKQVWNEEGTELLEVVE